MGMTNATTTSIGEGERGTRIRLGILFLTVFVDLIGFGIVLPLLPFYADRFGASGTEIALLVLSYSAAQLVMAPIWGRLSDRFGRRPILIFGLVGSSLSYLVFAYAATLPLLLLSRVMAGIGGANIPVAQAYIADITPPEKRAGNLGLIGAAFGLGFVFGPALGGVLAPLSPALPGLVAATFCGVNALLALFLLPESLSPGERARVVAARAAAPSPRRLEALTLVLGTRRYRDILLVTFLFTMAFSAMHPTFSLFAAGRFGLSEVSVGWLFTFMGVFSALMQGLGVRALVARIGEARLILACSIPFVAGLLVIALSPVLSGLLLGLALLAVGFGGTLPSLASLLSQTVGEDVQGGALGIGQSVGAMARVVGPLLAGILWDQAGPAWPYLAGAALALLAGGISLRLLREERVHPGWESDTLAGAESLR